MEREEQVFTSSFPSTPGFENATFEVSLPCYQGRKETLTLRCQIQAKHYSFTFESATFHNTAQVSPLTVYEWELQLLNI